MLHHKTVVGSDIRFTLHTVEYNTFCRASLWRAKLYERRKSCAAHTRNTCILYTVDYLFRGKLRMVGKCLELVAAVYALLPFVAFHINIYGRMAVTCCINGRVDLYYRSRH